MELIVTLMLILPAIIYKVTKDAAHEGTINALIEFEKYKNEELEES